MTSLNIGCGGDPWGDIGVDLSRSPVEASNHPNVVASALRLPIRDGVIQEIRCWHAIEHITDWRGVLDEIARVSKKGTRVQLRFPIDDGFKRDFLINWSRFDIPHMRHSCRTRRDRFHVWIVNPALVSQHLSAAGFFVRIGRNRRKFFPPWLSRGKKGKIFGRLYPYFPEIDYEWELNAIKDTLP
jgi:Methyltransferase domain